MHLSEVNLRGAESLAGREAPHLPGACSQVCIRGLTGSLRRGHHPRLGHIWTRRPSKLSEEAGVTHALPRHLTHGAPEILEMSCQECTTQLQWHLQVSGHLLSRTSRGSVCSPKGHGRTAGVGVPDSPTCKAGSAGSRHSLPLSVPSEQTSGGAGTTSPAEPSSETTACLDYPPVTQLHSLQAMDLH